MHDDALATRAGKPHALIGEELVVHGWHVRVIKANILEQQPEFFVGFSIVYTFAGPSHDADRRGGLSRRSRFNQG